jgi:ribosome biogenesis GTPase / thiamine phosphate phosphatase
MSKRRLSDQQHRRIAKQHTDAQARASHTPLAEGHLEPEQEGLLISPLRNQADIECPASGRRQRCHLRANLPPVAAGDRVIWRPGEPTGVVVSLLPRRNQLHRPDAYGKLKLVAANIDRALIILAPEPQAHANLIDRYLVAFADLDIEPVLVLNKSDLLGEQDPSLVLLRSYQDLGYPVLHLSAKQPQSLADLQQLLSLGTSILVGQSGVGKSSLLQALLPDEVIKVGALSEAVAKGRHTTTHARLYAFPGGGHCIDSPGIREFGLSHLSQDAIAAGFVEFAPYLGHCKFRNCQHQQEPGCALRQALAEGAIGQARFTSYWQIRQSLSEGQGHD